MVDPAAAARNYKRMAGIGARGGYGWYEALDYTRARLPEGAKFAIVRAYMAHHQAMTIVAIANALQDGACARASMPSRSSRRPSFCCRSACRAMSPSRVRRRNRSTAATQIDSLVPEIQRRYTIAAFARAAHAASCRTDAIRRW